MKKWIIGIMLATGMSILAGSAGLPTDRVAFPEVGDGKYLVCVWDETADGWYFEDFIEYDHSGSYTFTAPEWNKWYWIGLWNSAKGKYEYGTWIGHIKTDGD